MEHDGQIWCDRCGKCCAKKLAATQAEVEALRKGAERYLVVRDWLRGGQSSAHPLVGPLLGLVQGRKRWPIPASQIDIAVDAASAAMQPAADEAGKGE